MKIASTLLIGLVAGATFAQMDPSKEMFFTDTKAVLLLPPTVVSNSLSHQPYWSPNGKYLLLNSLEMKMTPNVIELMLTNRPNGKGEVPYQVVTLYDVAGQSSKVLMRTKIDAAQIGDVSWLPGSTIALITGSIPIKSPEGAHLGDRQLLWSSVVMTGKVNVLFQAEENEFVDLVTDDRANGAILVVRKFPTEGKEMTSRYLWIAKDGRIGASISATGFLAHGRVVFFQDGKRPMLIGQERVDSKAFKTRWFDLDFANSGTLKETQPIDIKGDTEPEYPFVLVQGGTNSVTESKSLTFKAAWLVAKAKGPHQSALVAAEVDQMSLSPARNAVFYSTKGVAMVRTLHEIPKEVALKALEAAEKARIMSDAKQVAMALHIYAADYDDVLPGNGGDWAEALYPYTKNRQLLDGFIYTFGGGNLGDIKDPSKTELGYKSGPGGRAVAYADGHVKWIPDP